MWVGPAAPLPLNIVCRPSQQTGVVCHALLMARKGTLPVGNSSEFRGLGRKRALLGTSLAHAWRDSVLCLASISGPYFESPRRYLLSLYLQGRATLTLTAANSIHCRPFSIACCLPSDALAAALAGRWRRGSRKGWEWVWVRGKGWSGWARRAGQARAREERRRRVLESAIWRDSN